MKRIDKYWRGWGVSAYTPRGWYIFRTPFGSLGVDSHRRVTPPWFSRGRCRERELRIPLTEKWQIHLSTKGDDYLTLVNDPKYLRSINWILDEFDSSFNDLAIASLRYHLDWSVCDKSRYRDVYEDLIERLSERSPRFTPEELAVLHVPGRTVEEDFLSLNEPNPERDAIYERHWQREDEYHARINKARHDFVDIMGGLWS